MPSLTISITFSLVVVLIFVTGKLLRHINYLTFLVTHLSRQLNVEPPKTLSNLLSLYNIPEALFNQLKSHLENNNDFAARRLLKAKSDLSIVEIEQIVDSARYLTPQKNFLRNSFL